MTTDPDLHAQVQALTDKLEIIELLNRYGVAIDARDWDLFRTVFTDDCVADYGRHGRWDGMAAFLDVFEPIHTRWPSTQHLIGNHQVTVDGDRARSRTYIHALLVQYDTPGGDNATIRGYYDDELVRTPDGWRIAHRRFNPSHYGGNRAILGFAEGEQPQLHAPWQVAAERA